MKLKLTIGDEALIAILISMIKVLHNKGIVDESEFAKEFTSHHDYLIKDGNRAEHIRELYVLFAEVCGGKIDDGNHIFKKPFWLEGVHSSIDKDD